MGDNRFFDTALYQQEIFYDDLQKGQTFAPYRYRLDAEYVHAYLQAVGEDNTLYRDETAAHEAGFEGAIVPPYAILSYGFIYLAMKGRPPTGYLNTAVRFEFLAPVRAGSEVTMRLSVADKFIKRERKYIILKAVVSGARDETVACAYIDCIFPA